MTEKLRGGKRPGAGRKTRWGEETVTIAVRVPKSKAEEVKQLIKNFIESQK